MARRFAKFLEEEIEEAFCYPSDLANTKTTIPARVGEERWIYTSTLRFSVYIHHFSPPLRGIVVYYASCNSKLRKDHDRPPLTSPRVFAVATLSYVPSKLCSNKYDCL